MLPGPQLLSCQPVVLILGVGLSLLSVVRVIQAPMQDSGNRGFRRQPPFPNTDGLILSERVSPLWSRAQQAAPGEGGRCQGEEDRAGALVTRSQEAAAVAAEAAAEEGENPAEETGREAMREAGGLAGKGPGGAA